MNAYLNLTKPRISLLFAFTGLTALVLEASLLHSPFKMLLICLGIFLVGGSANGLNQYFERDRDAQMKRTAYKRPLPLGLITPKQALIFCALSALVGNSMLFYFGGKLALFFGVGTIIFYSFYYTLWLKPKTPYNIVIGGIAGATGPLIAWSAVTGSLSWSAFILFLIIFMWTPPHFWALALACKEDYQKVSLPMLPIVKGEDFTRKQILLYSFSLPFLCAALVYVAPLSRLYNITAIILNVLFVAGALVIYKKHQIKLYWMFFAYSILYLMLLFGVIVLDALMK